MPEYIQMGCPDGPRSLGQFTATAIGHGLGNPGAAISDANQNAQDQIMMEVPWVFCSGDCEPVFTLTQVAPVNETSWEYSAYTPRRPTPSDPEAYGARVVLTVDVKVQCVDKSKIKPGQHVLVHWHPKAHPGLPKGD